MFHLKAGFLGGSTAALIRKAVEAYQPQLQKNICCGKEMSVIKETESIPYTFDEQKCIIKVANIPMWKCWDCGEVEEDVMLMASIEDSTDQKFEALIKSGNIPDKIELDFDDMLREPETAS